MGQEAEAEKRKEIFKEYQINENLMKHANKDAIILHCLPILKGEEFFFDEFENDSKNVYNLVENRKLVYKAIVIAILI